MSKSFTTIFYPLAEKSQRNNKENINYESPLKHPKASQANNKKFGNIQLLSLNQYF